ncbi:MAG: T9SS type A sorting domain-containing protein [Bacteroidota bacterium]
MKKITLLFLVLMLIGMTHTANAQKRFHGKIHDIKEKRETTNYTGAEVLDGTFQPSIHQLMYEQAVNTDDPENDFNPETWIGFTSYDLQTNGSVKQRVYQGPQGNIAASWTYHPETSDPATGFPNRGTGYNRLENGNWGGFPTSRLESTRTGWPNNVFTESGREVVVCHAFTNDGFVVVLTRDPGQTNFTETALPTDVMTTDMLWPHLAVSGNTLHVLAIARPVDDGVGGIHEGLDGAVLYYRSQDGGDTWDVQDYLVPAIDSSFFNGHDVDGYAIDARGDHVAFALFNGFADVVLLESQSNGDPGTWTKRIVNDFPLDKHVTDSGYTVDDIGGVDPDGPTDSLAIESSDGSGGIDIDAEGRVHVVYGRTYVSDSDLTNGFTVFFPGFSGIFYWNTDMADDANMLIDPVFDALDIDANDTIDSGDDLAFYGGGLTSMADIIVTDQGCAVVSYAQHMENYLRDAVAGSANFPESQNYRHVHITTSGDNGASWTPPYDVTNPDVLFFPALLAQTEAVYPHIYNDGSNTIHLSYQMDEEPGIFVYNANDDANDPVTSNTIAHWDFETDDPDLNFCAETTSTEEIVDKAVFNFELQPNPAFGEVQISYFLPEAAKADINIFNMMGQQIKTVGYGDQLAGEQQMMLDVSDLSAGIYLLTLRTNNKLTTQKLVVK